MIQSTNIDNMKEEVAKILLAIDAIKLSPRKPFTYASGILSPVYTDCRLLISYPKERTIIRDFYIKTIINSGVKPDVIAGTATAGIPHAAWIAEKMRLPMVFVRGKAKDHGRAILIEGHAEKGQNAIVIEDLISTGESCAHTAKTLRDEEIPCNDVFAIITYGMKKAQENFALHNLVLHALTDFQTVVTVAKNGGYIKKNDQQIVLDWIKDPPSWGKRMGFE